MGISRRQVKRNAARRLRRDATIAERRVWSVVRNRRLLGLKFRRQHVIRGFIVDFYCREARLVLEVDGASHHSPESAAYDRERSAVLEGLGLTVMRISNEDATREHLEDLLTQLKKSQQEPDVASPLSRRTGEGVRG